MVKKRRGAPEKYLWKKGQSGNPLGGAAHNPEVRAIRNLTRQELVEVANVILQSDATALKDLAKDDKQSVLKRMVAATCLKIMDSGDTYALDKLLDRLIGKVKEVVEHQGAISNPQAQVVVMLPDNGRSKK